MSKTIDNRVVEMQFNNKNFEQNVSTSMSTIDKLKRSLNNLSGASKGLDDLGKSTKNIDMSGLSKGIETVQAKFSTLQVVGITAISNITNSAVNAGKRMVKALTIDPIKTGFQEYETQIGAIQTILANTESKGSTLQDVNRALAELNTYADKTIYNFTEMTKNIGTFTAAGVDLEKSVTSIKGIANLAAISGSTSLQASTAMYQLSQALAAGRVSLMDWNSVVNAGMGGEVFQTALKRTATQMGTNVDALIEKYGSFRESLTQGNWLTAEVLTETLTQLSGAYSEADLIAQGYTKKQAQEIVKLADTAVSAATEVKTFTQLWDTLKEAAQSGWTQSWQTIVGDFGEAKELLTSINNVVSDMINKSAEARNKVLSEGLSSGWKQMLNQGIADEEGFKDSIKSVAKERGIAIDKMIKDSGSFEKSLKQGWLTSDILAESIDKMTKKVSGLSVEQLKSMGYTNEQVEELKKLDKAVKDGTINLDEFSRKIAMDSGRENMISGLKNIFESLVGVIKPVGEAFRDIFPSITGDQLYNFTEKFEILTEKFKIGEETASKLKDTFKGVFSIFDLFGKGISTLLSPIGSFLGSGGIGSIADIILTITSAIGRFITSINESVGVGNFFSGVSEALSNGAIGISSILKSATEGLDGFIAIISSIGNAISNLASIIMNGLGAAFKWISENVSIGDIFAGLAGGGIFALANKFGDVLTSIRNGIEGLFKKDKLGIGEKFASILDSVHDSLESFTTGIKVTTLLTIASAVGILSIALKSISNIEPTKIAKSLTTIGVMLTMLNLSFKSITKSLSSFDSKGIVKAGITLITISTAINILSTAIEKISKLDLAGVSKGLLGIGVGLISLVTSLKFISGLNISLKTSIAVIALAEACKKLSEAFSEFGNSSWSGIAKGLVGIGGALTILVSSLSILNKIGGTKSIAGAASILIVVKSLDDISEALQSIGSMSWSGIAKGLVGMGLALTELSLAVGILGKIAGFSGVIGAASILIVAQSLQPIYDTLQSIGSMSWSGIAKGLVGMGVALTELGLVVGILGTFASFGSILGAASILIVAQSLQPIYETLQSIGSMSWGEVTKGLVGMGLALTELGLVVGTLGTLAHLGGILGSGAILIGVQGLDELANALNKFGEMSWEGIAKGLVGMGGALTELALITGTLGTLAPLGALVGSGSLYIAIQGLNDLANALNKFGEMSWDEIGRGLTAMGAALSETALGGLLNTFSGFGGDAIAKVVEPLDKLANGLKKFGEMSWDQIKNGVAAMKEVFGETALGGLLNTFSGFGGDAIAVIAEPLGKLSDSVKKWNGVTVPEGLGSSLGSIAEGVRSFTVAGFGADAISTSATSLGVMADSVKKWIGITVPEGLGDQLAILAKGVKSFWLAGSGAEAISTSAAPLGVMADSVRKWTNIEIPEGMTDKLKELATGVKSWNGVSISENLGANLTSLSQGVKSFVGVSAQDLSLVCKQISDSAKSFVNIDLNGVTSKINNFIRSITNFSNINVSNESFSKLGQDIVNKLINSIKSSSSKMNSVGTILINGIINGIKSKQSSLSSVASTLANSLVKAINSKSGSLRSAGASIANGLVSSIKSKQGSFSSAATTLINKFISGITNGKSKILKTFSTTLSSSVSKIRSFYDDFFSAGKYVASGFANGISANSFLAVAKSRAMASAAASAARSALDINSPSKVFEKIGSFVPLGFIKGLSKFSNKIKNTSISMSDYAISGTKNVISRISSIINSNVDTQPRIRPVLDLNNIKSGVGVIDSLLDIKPSLGAISNVRSINSSMNNQNGFNDDVVSAIKDLKNTINDSIGDNYNINGITYDDGSNVSDAVKSLVRAAKMERRV